MGEFIIEGNKSLDLIQFLCTNDASKLRIGQAQYSCMTNSTGGIVDDLIIYRLKEQSYLLVVNASNIEKDWNWINSNNRFGARIKNISDEYSLLAIQGPKAIIAMQSLTNINLKSIGFYNFKIGKFADMENVIISATGYTGSGGFEIYCRNNQVINIWNKVFEVGKNYNIKPAGLAARDTLRLEMGYCLYGNDIDEDTSPIEAGLGWITKFSKDFINSKKLKRQKLEGTKKKLVGIELLERGIPRKGYEIVNDKNVVIGNITSGTMSPTLSKGIGMGYIDSDKSMINSKVGIKIRNKVIAAKIVKTPFVII
tara:strand:+ start:12 stop:944 length:933 start_codon:yes stop_codon:yes gene_type:complete